MVNIDEKEGIVVIRRQNEDIESLIKRFKKKVHKSGILKDLRNKAFYEKPSDKKRRRKNEAKTRAALEKQKIEKLTNKKGNNQNEKD